MKKKFDSRFFASLAATFALPVEVLTLLMMAPDAGAQLNKYKRDDAATAPHTTPAPRTAPARGAGLNTYKKSKPDGGYRGADAYNNFEHIAYIKLPPGWWTSKLTIMPGRLTQRFKPQEKMETCVDFFITELPAWDLTTRPAEYDARKKILAMRQHTMNDTEIKMMPELLREYGSKVAEPLQMVSCRTFELGGKRGFFIEAKTSATNGLDEEQKILEYIIDVTGKGRDFVAMSYRADVSDYKKYLPPIVAAVNSVRWK